ncbi:MAG: hypothetical protein OEV62_03325 [Actinomycetota bacterium]|nr:hypothetical protein [Actinomycetota bacterium]
MNKSAEQHLAKAKDYIAKGDEFYRKSKPEIDAAVAKGANTSEIARYLSRSRTWVVDVLAWDGTGTLYGKDTDDRQMRQARQVVRESADDLISSLPDDQLERLAQAAHNEQIERIRKSGDTSQSVNMAAAGEQMRDARDRSVMPILNLNHALSALRIADPIRLIGYATNDQRGQWRQQWEEDIDMLAAMIEAVSTVDLKVVSNAQ